jgi:[calcium/calmodulin-dependent protein kinase] kinase
MKLMSQDMEQVNQYRLLNIIGRGSCGYVRLCQSQSDSTSYAMKCVSKRRLLRQDGLRRPSAAPQGSPGRAAISAPPSPSSGLQNLKREVAILKKLSHPNIVRLYEVIEDEQMDTIYMVFELLSMGPVMDLTVHPEPFSEIDALMYFRQLVLAVEYLHHQNIVHRDIKPSNILLFTENFVKLTDFGLSYVEDPEDTQPKKTMGTPMFLAPEAINGGTFDGKPADVWALGVTLYCFLFGQTPWRETLNVLQLYAQIRDELPEFPSRCRLIRHSVFHVNIYVTM